MTFRKTNKVVQFEVKKVKIREQWAKTSFVSRSVHAPLNFRTANVLVLKDGTLPLNHLFSNTLLATFDIIGSAEALPILCVSDFCERERERERERDACDVIRYHAEIASDHAYDYLDGASTQRVEAFWACRVFMHKTRSLVFERSSSRQWSSDLWMTLGSVSFAFAGEPVVDHPVPFRWHARF